MEERRPIFSTIYDFLNKDKIYPITLYAQWLILGPASNGAEEGCLQCPLTMAFIGKLLPQGGQS